MKLSELLCQAKSLANQSGIAEADFLFLLSVALEMPVPQLYLDKARELDEQLGSTMLNQFTRICQNEAPQYICGKAYFYGHELQVSPACLIPRPETEGLVELVLGKVLPNMRVLDIGTGSGAIAIALKKANPGLQVSAIDLSSAALELARINAAKLNAEITFYLGDVFPRDGLPYDVIVSNPPYISQAEYAELNPRVRLYEPSNALLAGEDGLDFYRILLKQAAAHLNSGALLALEHGANQQKELILMAKELGWENPEAYKDLCGRDRYLLLSRK